MGRLFWKILFTFWLTLLIAGGVSGLTVWWHQHTWQNLADDVVVRPSAILAVKAAANTFRFGGQPALVNMLQEQQREAPFNLQVYAVNPQGQELLGRSVSADTLQRVRDLAKRNVSPPIVRQEGTFLLFAPLAGQFPQFQSEKGHQLPPAHRYSTPTLIVSGIIISFLSSFLLAWYFAKPIRSLRGAFQALANGDLSRRVSPTIGTRRDELADLGKDFDHMATQLQNLMSSQRRLLHDVSHELRSPLARLQVSIGLARQQPDKLASSLERIEHEAGRLDKLVGEVLTLSRLEAGGRQNMEDYLDILELIDAVVDDASFEAQALSCQVAFQCDLEDSPVIKGHGELLYRAIENVVRNAIHHTPPHTTVVLSVHRDTTTTCLQLTVDDQGPGVPEHELNRIFEPFQRSTSNPQVRQGYGLGLAIARRAIERHGGSIRAYNRQPQGLRVNITLPPDLAQP